MSGHIIYLTRSGVQDRQECPRLHFLSSAYPIDGKRKGLQRRSNALPLLRGTTAHAAFARVLSGWSMEKTISAMREEYHAEVEARGIHGIPEDVKAHFISEQLHLMECVLRGWVRVRLPLILEEEDPVSIEQEWEWEIAPGVKQPMRFDYIGRRKADGLLVIRDWKTASTISDDWAVKFEHDLQTNLYVLGLMEHSGEEVGGITYEGLLVGPYRRETAKSVPWTGQKVQQSYYCYGYMLPDSGGNGQHLFEPNYVNRKGWQKFFVPEVMSAEAWVDIIEKAGKLGDFFTVVPNLSPPPGEMDSIRRQVVSQTLAWEEHLGRYEELLEAGEEEEAQRYLDLFAPQHTSRCVKFGADNRCPFYTSVCFNDSADPIADGEFEPRVLHHNIRGEEAA